MTRRFLFPLAASVVGLVALSPVLAAEQSTPAANVPAKATTTTAPPDDSMPPPDDSPSDPGTDSGSGSEPGSGSGSGSESGSGSGSGSGAGSGSGSRRSSSVCDPPEVNKGPAPQIGDPPQTHEAGQAGSVDVERLSDTELRIVNAAPNDGWTEQVATPSGPRVTVKFTRQGQSPTLIRFAATMDQRGTMIHTRVTSCG